MIELEILGEEFVDLTVSEPHFTRTKREEHGGSAAQVQKRRGRDLGVLGLQKRVVFDLGYGAGSKAVAVRGLLRRIQDRLVGRRLALVHGQPLAQVLHLLLHFGIAVALADALEVGLDDAS